MDLDDFALHAEAELRRRGGRVGASRRALLELLGRSRRPLGPRELHQELRRSGVRVNRVSVYRNVSALLGLGLLHRVLGSTAVRPCTTAIRPARATRRPRPARCHHAIVCTGCGQAREFHSGALERALAEVRRATRFRVQGHLLELRGLCESCQP